jgi:polyketide cyclase/dehydrase/lipid transport protein
VLGTTGQDSAAPKKARGFAMKILLILIAALVLSILAIVAIGALLPKRHVASRSASYRATPDQLFALIAGPQNWRPDVTQYELLPCESGRELVRETSTKGETIDYELLDRTPPTLLKRRIASENLPYAGTWTFSLQPNGGNTTVRITEEGQVYNPIFRFMTRFVLGYTKTMDAYLRALGKATGSEVQPHN